MRPIDALLLLVTLTIMAMVVVRLLDQPSESVITRPPCSSFYDASDWDQYFACLEARE